MTDWAVWPIFLIQAIAFALLFFPKSSMFLGFSAKAISLSILFISCILIAASLYHDSTEVLNFYF